MRIVGQADIWNLHSLVAMSGNSPVKYRTRDERLKCRYRQTHTLDREVTSEVSRSRIDPRAESEAAPVIIGGLEISRNTMKTGTNKF
jgi:hypothetical protein